MSRRSERVLRNLDQFFGLPFVKGLMTMTLIVLFLMVAVSAESSILQVVQVEEIDFLQF